nr:TPA_asm: nucleocapsid [Diachasmavirus orthomyxi]
MTDAPAPKRKRVDPITKAATATDQRGPVNLDSVTKNKVLKFITNAHQLIHTAVLGKLDPNLENIGNGIQVHNILFSVFNVLRQIARGAGKGKEALIKSTGCTVTYKGKVYNVSYDVVKPIVEDCARKQGLIFQKFDINSKENWYSTACPIMDLYALYGMRVDEQRLGYSTVTIGKDGADGPVLDCATAQWGIKRQHDILCDGLNYAPEKKSSLAQSLGPMTIMWMLSRAQGPYQKKWKDAALRVMKMIPRMNEIIELVANKPPTEVRALFEALGNVLLITGSRQAMRATMPPNILCRLFAPIQDPNAMQVDEIVVASGGSKGGWVWPPILEHFTFSGRGFYMAYKLAQDLKWEMAGKGLDAPSAQQIVFHACFGSHKEDFGILPVISDVANWKRRVDIKDMYKEHSGTHLVNSQFIKLNYYSKMSSANPSGLLTETSTQVAGGICWAGKRTKLFTKEFFDTVKSDEDEIIGVGTIRGHVAALHKLFDKERDALLAKGGTMDYGNAQWYTMESCDIHKEPVPVILNLKETGRYFLGGGN